MFVSNTQMLRVVQSIVPAVADVPAKREHLRLLLEYASHLDKASAADHVRTLWGHKNLSVRNIARSLWLDLQLGQAEDLWTSACKDADPTLLKAHPANEAMKLVTLLVRTQDRRAVGLLLGLIGTFPGSESDVDILTAAAGLAEHLRQKQG